MKHMVCLFDCLCLVVGSQERRVQYKTRKRKKDIQAEVDNSENIKAIGQWSQERIYLCSMCKLQLG